MVKSSLRWKLLAYAVVGLFATYAGYDYARLPQAGELAKKNPATTALMEQRAEEAKEQGRRPVRRQQWVALDQIAKAAVDAVLLSEDSAFFQHEGIDAREMKNALQESWEKRKLGRGASTITMQVAKNLWLSTDRSILRKMKELVLTHRLEEALTKNRILSLYLNIAEWGEGVYGIEAAARTHFGVSAADLSPGQSVILATMLPAPRKWAPSQKSKNHRGRAMKLIDRLEAVGRFTPTMASDARAEVDRVLGEAHGAPEPEGDTEGAPEIE
jgi:monofunctional glycosyltransferase